MKRGGPRTDGEPGRTGSGDDTSDRHAHDQRVQAAGGPAEGEGEGDHAADAVRVTARARPGAHVPWLVLVVAVVGVALAWWWLDRPRPVSAVGERRAETTAPGPEVQGRAAEAGMQPGPGASGVTRGPALAQADAEDPTPDLSDYVLPGEAPTMGQVIDALHARGIRTGLGAFQPPGTSPPLEGLVVPDDFPLPDGYVRHHQATDDGQPIEPILMFGPDVDSVVVNGIRVQVPSDRVVPPALAPPGLPLQRVRIPPPLDAGGRP